jgi:very-short-patch-repair endonuclease|nr:MAG TPA: Protein of unknown function (DUF559) [Caudoviricetes sp.]
MKNNRNIDIRSLKGPRRRLKLEVIEGKRYIKKRDLKKYFFDDMWSIKDFRYHFGLGHRIVRGSLNRYFSKEEIDKSHRDKIAIKQTGDKNSNHINWYRPRKLIPLSELEESIKLSKNKKELKNNLNLSSWELSYIQQYYNFRLPNKNTLVDDFSNNNLSKKEIIILAKMLKTFELDNGFLGNDIKDIHQSIINLLSLTYDLRIIIKKLKKYYREYPYYYPTNLIEYQFFKVMKRMKLNVIPQFFIEKLHIHVDFLIDDYIILELDGQLHNYQKDKVRDLNLNSLGYKVVRIDLKKENLNRFPKIKDIRLCLKKYLLKV